MNRTDRKVIKYEGYDIDYNFYGKGEYTVFWDGDDHIFWCLNDAQVFIDQSIHWERKMQEEAEYYLSESEFSEDY